MRRALAVALLTAIAWLYFPVVRGLVVQWMTSPDASYGAIIAAVALILIWQRRFLLRTSRPTLTSTLGGLFAVIAGLALYLAGQLAADVFTTRSSLVVLAGGLVAYLAGAGAARAVATPLLFLLLAIPLPELLVTNLTGSLQSFAAQTAEFMLTSVGIPVYRDGNVLDLPTSTLQVIEACSGMRSAVSLAAVGILLAWASDTNVPRRILLVAATLPIAVLVNGIRLAGTGVASEVWGGVATRDPWHSLAGWLTFIVSLAALWATRRALDPAPSHRSSHQPLAAHT